MLSVHNDRLLIPRAHVASGTQLIDDIESRLRDLYPLRWFVAGVQDENFVVEVAHLEGSDRPEFGRPHLDPPTGNTVVVNLIPTGIGCEIGGYAGDAGPVNALLATTVDILVSNPNTVNASDFLRLPQNMIYAEGWMIDQWVAGQADMCAPRRNKIGVLIEESEPRQIAEIVRVIEAVRSVHGADIIGYAITKGSIGTTCKLSPSGAYTGTIERPDALLEGVGYLVNAGATAVAVTSRLNGLDEGLYAKHFNGKHPNPVGAAEAILSHLVISQYGLPCAHAPLANFRSAAIAEGSVDPRGAAEYVSSTGLGCVLVGLAQAPQMTSGLGAEPIQIADALAVVAPASALGGRAVLHAHRRGIPIIAVAENATVLDVSAKALGLQGVIGVQNYLEAAGTILALKHSISADSLRRPLAAVEEIYAQSIADELDQVVL